MLKTHKTLMKEKYDGGAGKEVGLHAEWSNRSH